jgi:hypothetical protein
MHFRLPKPLHGWREFAGEVGIIVVGVLIALAAEQLVEEWRWERQASQADRAFKSELLYAAGNSYERLAVQPCLQGRLRALAAQLNGSSGQWHAMPETFRGAGRFYTNVLPVVYRPPVRPVVSDAWRNALGDGTINHLDAERAQYLSSAYEELGSFGQYQAEEASMATRISPLSADRPMDQRTRIEMLQTLAQLDRLNELMVTTANGLISAIHDSKLGITDGEIQRIRRDTVALQRSYRGTCVRTDVPLKLS